MTTPLVKYKDAEVYVSEDVASGLFKVESHDVYLAADVDAVLTKATKTIAACEMVMKDLNEEIAELKAAARLASWKMHIEYRRLQPDADKEECWSEVEQLDALLEEPPTGAHP